MLHFPLSLSWQLQTARDSRPRIVVHRLEGPWLCTDRISRRPASSECPLHNRSPTSDWGNSRNWSWEFVQEILKSRFGLHWLSETNGAKPALPKGTNQTQPFSKTDQHTHLDILDTPPYQTPLHLLEVLFEGFRLGCGFGTNIKSMLLPTELSCSAHLPRYHFLWACDRGL